ncbi:MAG: helix-turn-helix transcriptional regulator [Acidimicrobiia bacterium]|nr:helix-turn-helix transcriptional regulator [Acidimicrobiia bacterium]
MENAVPDEVAARIAAQTLAKRGTDYAAEVRRLLDAALGIIAEQGTTAKARVADIVAAAGLSNDAFYRHFPSKSALVDALIEDGAHRLAGYLGHQMAKETSPDGQVRRWVEGVLSQTDGTTGATTLAVLMNGTTERDVEGGPDATAQLGQLLVGPFDGLGSADPQLDATLVAHAVVGRLADHLRARTKPSRAERERLIRFAVESAQLR